MSISSFSESSYKDDSFPIHANLTIRPSASSGIPINDSTVKKTSVLIKNVLMFNEVTEVCSVHLSVDNKSDPLTSNKISILYNLPDSEECKGDDIPAFHPSSFHNIDLSLSQFADNFVPKEFEGMIPSDFLKVKSEFIEEFSGEPKPEAASDKNEIYMYDLIEKSKSLYIKTLSSLINYGEHIGSDFLKTLGKESNPLEFVIDYDR